MAMRRPRIKASANLMTSKRKPKSQATSSSPTLPDNESTNTENRIENEAAKSQENDKSIEQVDEIVKNDTKSTPEIRSQEECLEPAKEAATEAYVSEAIAAPEELAVNQLEIIEDKTAGTPAEALLNSSAEQVVVIATKSEASNQQETANTVQDKVEDKSFKCPTNFISFNRSNSNTITSGLSNAAGSAINDDVFNSDHEDVNVIQMDMQKSSSNSINACPLSPMSPSKARQRIRATPIFGQRRNSFVLSSPSPHTGDDGTPDFPPTIFHRRERHYSASLSQTSNASSSHAVHYHTPHKYVPLMHTGRIRTESGCSAFSDTYAASSKSRKNDDHHQHHRTLTRRDFEARFAKGVVPDKSTLKMFDLIYYNPETNPMEQKQNVLNMKQETTQNEDAKKSEDDKPASPAADAKTKDASATASSMPVPQLKLNSNGELILDDKSLVIETTAEQEARKALANSTLIFLDENTGMNGFYRKKKRTKEWHADETIKFYRCLQTVGTDFSLMCQLFPKRTRRDLKLKFKKEERSNLALINKAILYPKIFNIDELKLQLEAEEREREEAEKRWNELKARSAEFKKKRSKDYCMLSPGARALADGDEIYLNENITKEKLCKRSVKKRFPKIAKKNSKKTPKDNLNNLVNSALEENITLDADGEPPVKKKRCRQPRNPKIVNGHKKKQIKMESIGIFASGEGYANENIKEENQQQQSVLYEVDQLEMELDDLLRNQQSAEEMNGDDYGNNNNYNTDDDIHYIIQSPSGEASMSEHEGIECKSLVNMDDGTVTLIKDVNGGATELMSSPYLTINEDYAISLVEEDHQEQQDGQKQQQEEQQQQAVQMAELQQQDELEQQDLEESPKYNSSDMDESDIQQILTELSEGSMVLVSTLDPNNPDKLLNEIYMLDKATGELCDKPLDIPDAIVQCILSVMS